MHLECFVEHGSGANLRLVGNFLPLVALAAALVAQPAMAASSPELGSLERQLFSLVASGSSDVGIAALDLTRGTVISINGDQSYPMASTVKVAIAATYLAQVDHGRRSMSDPIGGKTAAQLMNLMLIHSDNRATDLLLNNLGGPTTVSQWLNFNGMSGMRIDRTIAQLLHARRDLRDRRDSATPMAMVELLRKIDSGNVLSTGSRALLLATMANCQTGRNRIKALLPFGTRVEHKTGTLDGLTDDVGFITLDDGRRIAVAIFARGGSNRAQTLAQAARAIYDGFRSSISSYAVVPGPPEAVN